MTKQIFYAEPAPLAKYEPVPIGQMMQAMIDKGITEQNVKAFEAMTALMERVEKREAEKAFAAAFCALQGELPMITATSIIPNRGKYEKFEDIMRVVKPLCTKHGFTISFSQDVNENRIVETCKVFHVAGHFQVNSFAVRTGGRSDSETQADCKAATTAKRLALCNAFNIVIQQDIGMDDSDASIEGDIDTKLTHDHYEHVMQRCEEVGADMDGFLAVFNVKKLSDVPDAKYRRALELLDLKEKKNQRTVQI